MTLEQKVGQVFVLGFEGTQLNADNRALIRNLHLAGVTLFARNIEHARQLAKLNRDLQSIAAWCRCSCRLIRRAGWSCA